VLGLKCVEFYLMFVLTLADGLCCAWIIYPALCWYRCPEMGTSSIDWAQLSRFRLETDAEFSPRNAVFYIKTGRWLKSGNTIIVHIFYVQYTCLQSCGFDIISYRQVHVRLDINLGGRKVRLTIIENKILW
jgi:hypothetical protein